MNIPCSWRWPRIDWLKKREYYSRKMMPKEGIFWKGSKNLNAFNKSTVNK
jgi:hypothetical protein